MGNSSELNSLAKSIETEAEADSSTCCGFLAMPADKLPGLVDHQFGSKSTVAQNGKLLSFT